MKQRYGKYIGLELKNKKGLTVDGTKIGEIKERAGNDIERAGPEFKQRREIIMSCSVLPHQPLLISINAKKIIL